MSKDAMRLFASVDDVYKALDDGVDIYTQFAFSHPTKTKGRSIKLSLGRIWFNLLLPSEIDLINEPVDKKILNNILKDYVLNHTSEESAEFITYMNQQIFKFGTYCPTSFEINAVILSPKIKKEKEELQKNGSDDPLEFSKEEKKVSKDLNDEANLNDYRFYNIHNSGAKDAPIDELLLAKGAVSDIEGNLSKPIRAALSDGQTIEDYYKCAGEARKGFYYKSAISAKPGYLARRIIMASAHIILDDSIKDCHTHNYFKILVTPEIAKSIKFRYYMDKGHPKLIEKPEELIGQTINLRSPLYCKSEKGICPICFGESYKNINNKNIGILAGGDIDNIALNGYMKLRHKSSVPEYIQINFIKDLTANNILNDEFKKYFLVEPNKIIANTNCYVTLDLGDYNEISLIESIDYYLIPGIFDITLVEDTSKTWHMPFPYQIKLMKPLEIQKERNTITLNYSAGETIITGDKREKTLDVTIMEKLLEGQMKYINNPEVLVMALREHMNSLDLNIIELIVENMCRDNTDPSKPARLTDYSNYTIYGQKRLPLLTSWVNAMTFENVGKAIKTGLVTGANAPDDPLTKIVNEKYEEQ